MSHEIDFSTGRPAFTFSKSDGPAWHGLGHPIPAEYANDPAKIAELAGADYTVEKRQVQFIDQHGKVRTVPNRMALVRNDTDEALDVVSDSKYNVHQPIGYFETFRDALAEARMRISAAGVLKGGRSVFVTAAFTEGSYEVVPGDRMYPYVIIGGDYTGKGSSFALQTTTRGVCWNTVSFAIRDAKGRIYKLPHTIGFNGKALAQAVGTMGEQFRIEAKVFNQLARSVLRPDEAGLFFADVLEVAHEDLTRVDPKTGKPVLSGKLRAQLNALATAYQNAPGATPGSLWGALNAVTYYVDHEAPTRDSYEDGTDASRFYSAKFGAGAQVKAQALELAIERAGIDRAELLVAA